MLDAATFFGKFKGRGLLHAATLTPAGGGAGVSFEARVMAGGVAALRGIGGNELSIQFATADAPGIAQGDTVAFGGRSFKVRDRDYEHCSPDGTLSAYRLREA